MKNWYFRFS